VQNHVHHHFHFHGADAAALAALTEKVNTLMIDTSKLLAAVAAEQTESASLRALLAANTTALISVDVLRYQPKPRPQHSAVLLRCGGRHACLQSAPKIALDRCGKIRKCARTAAGDYIMSTSARTTHDLGNGWFLNLMTTNGAEHAIVRNPDKGQRIDLPADSLARLRKIFNREA
jgi:hypothetical protein